MQLKRIQNFLPTDDTCLLGNGNDILKSESNVTIYKSMLKYIEDIVGLIE